MREQRTGLSSRDIGEDSAYMTDDSIPRCILLIALILGGGVFSGAETAFSYCNRARMKTLAGEGSAAAKRVVEILADYDKTIVTLLIVINILRVTAAAVSTVLAIDLIGSVGSVAATVVLTLFVFLVGETIPKNFAHVNSDSYAMSVSLLIKLLSFLLTPVSAVFTFTGNILKKVLRRSEKTPKLTEDEFQTLIENVEDENVLEPVEKRIICSAIEFGDLRAGDVMTVRENIRAVNIALSPDRIREKIIDEKYSRLPVYRGDLDHIVGVVQMRDYLGCLLNSEKAPALDKILLQPYRVPPDMKLASLFEGMSHRRSHLAVVTGIGGATLGVVTMNDILKEIIGESFDSEDDEEDGYDYHEEVALPVREINKTDAKTAVSV